MCIDFHTSLTGHHRGTHIKLNDLLLQGISVVQFAVARTQCVCDRLVPVASSANVFPTCSYIHVRTCSVFC
jgi:hypothetical protein